MGVSSVTDRARILGKSEIDISSQERILYDCHEAKEEKFTSEGFLSFAIDVRLFLGFLTHKVPYDPNGCHEYDDDGDVIDDEFLFSLFVAHQWLVESTQLLAQFIVCLQESDDTRVRAHLCMAVVLLDSTISTSLRRSTSASNTYNAISIVSLWCPGRDLEHDRCFKFLKTDFVCLAGDRELAANLIRPATIYAGKMCTA
ncbi:hypothetical protein KIN20_000048 [Parelaphostrongylus tenuis]|uniref:Uncharacterized protein n=1 Tax=Parelaphostrongylus tenuis TaxID=148309 RepID=A0AAD5LVJ5_PARTN|nr:hypothetical protein KIN20_000048 [Parelaphostrongylus tenuis]